MLTSKLSKNSRAFINILNDLKERDIIILIERFKRNKSLKKVAKQFNTTDTSIKIREDKLINLINQTFEYINL